MDKKQLIIPVLTLLLCASVIVGVGYGITSNTTVTDSDNGVAVEEITIDLKNGSGALANQAFDSGKIDYTTDIKYTGSGATKNTTYSIAAGQVVKLNDDNIKLCANKGGQPLTGNVIVTITGSALTDFQKYFTKMSLTIGSTVEDSDLSNGISFTINGFDGNPADVVITGTTNGDYKDETSAPTFTGTFDVKFSMAVNVQGTA